MLTFTRQEKKLKGIWWGAEAGAHDDLGYVLWRLLLQAKVTAVYGNGNRHKEVEWLLYKRRIE